jgi:hypothetical protein
MVVDGEMENWRGGGEEGRWKGKGKGKAVSNSPREGKGFSPLVGVIPSHGTEQKRKSAKKKKLGKQHGDRRESSGGGRRRTQSSGGGGGGGGKTEVEGDAGAV